jgi:acetolactate synthase-1/2/3 large subunit
MTTAGEAESHAESVGLLASADKETSALVPHRSSTSRRTLSRPTHVVGRFLPGGRLHRGALIGQPPKTLGGRGAFQDTSGVNGALDSEAPFTAVSVVWRRVETPADFVTALPQAVSAATRIRGPAVSLIPKGVQQGVVDGAGAKRHAAAASLARVSEMSARRLVDPRPIVDALRGRARPCDDHCGEQVARDDARAELEQLRAALRAR